MGNRCSICNGLVITMNNLVYTNDGSTSGTYQCLNCGKRKNWFKKGYAKEQIIDME